MAIENGDTAFEGLTRALVFGKGDNKRTIEMEEPTIAEGRKIAAVFKRLREMMGSGQQDMDVEPLLIDAIVTACGDESLRGFIENNATQTQVLEAVGVIEEFVSDPLELYGLRKLAQVEKVLERAERVQGVAGKMRR